MFLVVSRAMKRNAVPARKTLSTLSYAHNLPVLFLGAAALAARVHPSHLRM